MNRTMDEKEELVKKSLFSFVRKQVPTAQLSLIDDIVLSYVVSMVEEDALEENLDVEGLCEMVSACLPEFSTIDKEAVSKWLLEIESELRQGSKPDEDPQSHDPLSHISLTAFLPPEAQRIRVHHLSETSDAGSDSSGEYFAEESTWHQVALLQEMFPGASPAEARHCLAVAGGDIAKAAQLALHRQEAGQSLVGNLTFLTPSVRTKARVNDEELKSRIIARYSYVDRDNAVREHRPVAPKTEPKKLVRYLDNKIVSVKGERYTEVRRGDDDEGNEGGRKRGHSRP
ncbi:CUE domain-containing protein 2 isoform X2 [Neodiprion pinetum]|uniref:CUE domain-containing protein 2 isoform X2 n=1 Tax=Neodiprion lecontei TaxID=441921 RepID=A0A6J0C0D7_NEOLC|nr:CUE domain-containing protein 2 isoform X2 [Neodiprion lecontei]XP_046422933.1 CUE domain-containing protein 2 isoform X2 [Neodiprion fabricii]XP_046478511.1 CUE domain-containing protein 2 isoform X2 [Neodiprion pinetum]XP_046617022.1 CUE domain-containing protein 2 isoform X2 [Neodiprion virginianus]